MRVTEGMSVAVCYDGKWSRAVEGRVMAVGHGRRPHRPKWFMVRFLPWANEEAGFVDLLCEPNPEWRETYGGYLTGDGENSVMRMLGIKGDWYTIYPVQELAKNGYRIKPYNRPVPEDIATVAD